MKVTTLTISMPFLPCFCAFLRFSLKKLKNIHFDLQFFLQAIRYLLDLQKKNWSQGRHGTRNDEKQGKRFVFSEVNNFSKRSKRQCAPSVDLVKIVNFRMFEPLSFIMIRPKIFRRYPCLIRHCDRS